MLNLIQANLHRVRWSKTFRKSWMALMIVFILVSLMMGNGSGSLSLVSMGNEYGYVFSAQAVHGEYIQLLQPVLGFTGVLVVVMLCMVGEICITPYKTGGHRMAVTCGHSRSQIYLANLITSWIVILGLGLGIMGIAALVWGLLFSAKGILTIDQVNQVLGIIGVWCLLISTLTSSWVVFATWAKEKFIVIGLGVLLYSICIMPLVMMFEETWVMNGSPILILMGLCGNPLEGHNLIQYIVSSLSILSVTTLIGCYMSKKEDI
ncbi:MAG: hypothetical protein ACRCTE_05570 [Cellulosilyticaceae bacterium]